MLGKLIKHEFKATARYFLPIYIIALLLTPVTRITHELGQFKGILKFIPTVITTAYVFSIIAVFAACILIIIYRFYKSMVTEEGYLMHTLPVTPAQHIWSKLIVSSFWTVVSMIVVSLSMVIMFFTRQGFADFIEGYREFLREFSELNNYLSSDVRINMVLLIIELILIMLIVLLTSPLVYYASIAIGQVIAKNKVVGSIAGYFLIQFATQILGIVSFVLIGNYINNSYMDIGDEAMFAFLTVRIFPIFIAGLLIIAVIYFLFTNYIFKRKLNLE